MAIQQLMGRKIHVLDCPSHCFAYKILLKGRTRRKPPLNPLPSLIKNTHDFPIQNPVHVLYSTEITAHGTGVLLFRLG